MLTIQEILSGMKKMSETENNSEHGCDRTKLLQKKADAQNEIVGNLTGYDCQKCKNRGYINVVSGTEIIWRICPCKKVRESIERIRRSGLEKSIKQMTFDTYKTPNKWQENALELAKKYVADGTDQWFFMGGQSGMGKTHLCTAISAALLNTGRELHYMRWVDESKEIKSLVNDYSKYQERINFLKKVDLLYIDDLFKPQQGTAPSSADVNLAFEILNHRLSNNLQTIISSERTLTDLIEVDEALGSRIYQMSKDFCINSSRDPSKNYRLNH